MKTAFHVFNRYYYTSHSLWKIWLVESIQSIHTSLRTWHDKCNICWFIMSSSTSAWLLSPLECSPHKQNGWTLRFCVWGWILWKMYNKIIIEYGFRMISWIIKTSCLCYLPQPSASANKTDLGFDNSWYHAQPHPIIVYYETHCMDLCQSADLTGRFCYKCKPCKCGRVFLKNLTVW